MQIDGEISYYSFEYIFVDRQSQSYNPEKE